MFDANVLTFREFMRQESLPLATIQSAVLEFLGDRDDVVLFGAQAVNAYVGEPRMTQDIDLLSPRALEFAQELRGHLSERFHIAVRVREVGEGRGFRLYQVQKAGNRHLVDVRAVESLPATQRIAGVLVIAPADLIASKALSYRPFVGIRGAWLLQDYSTKVHGGDFAEDPSTAFHAHNDYRGWGLRAGFNMLYHFCKSWALYGDISGSLLWGDFHVNSKWRGNNPTTDVLETLFREKERFHRVRTNVEVGLGLMWETFFHKDKMHVSFAAGYELTQWFMQNQLRQFIGWGGIISDSFNVPQSGDLGLQGLTVSGRLDF